MSVIALTKTNLYVTTIVVKVIMTWFEESWLARTM